MKTRLARSIGADTAARLYRAFLVETLHLGRQIECRHVIGFTPDTARDAFRELAPDWDLVPQANGDLGHRMQSFFDQILSGPPLPAGQDRRVVLIGSDTPTLDASLIGTAFDRLLHDDVVIGPSDDGGYYLIGARNRTPDLFADVAWSTESVLKETLGRLNQGNYRYSLLESRNDVDDLADLLALKSELESGRFPGDNDQSLLSLLTSCVQSINTDRGPVKQDYDKGAES